jgi:hypothetical protein
LLLYTYTQAQSEQSVWFIEAVKWRITDEILGLSEIDWDIR